MSGSLTTRTTMQALILDDYRGADGMKCGERKVPRPAPGEVLIRMAAAPINPSDLIFINGDNPSSRMLPTVPGFEGAGVVIESGGGDLAEQLLDKRVACRATPAGDGTWAQYCVTEASRCIPLAEHVSFEQGATLLVNPLTGWTLVDTAIEEGHAAAIQTAAAGALGKMIAKFADERKLPLINIVRKAEHIEVLEQLGAKYILNSQEPGFDLRLKKLASNLNATVAFEAVSGDIANVILKAMPRGSQLWAYGGLSRELCKVDPVVLIYEEKSVRGFWGPILLYKSGPERLKRAVDEIQSKIDSTFKTEVRSRYSLIDFNQALNDYQSSMSSGKILFVHSLE